MQNVPRSKIFCNAQRYFQNVGDSKSIPGGGVTAIEFAPDGMLWLGTQSGVLRYDGYRFKRYRFDPANENSIAGDFISALKVAREVRGSNRVGAWSPNILRIPITVLPAFWQTAWFSFLLFALRAAVLSCVFRQGWRTTSKVERAVLRGRSHRRLRQALDDTALALLPGSADIAP